MEATRDQIAADAASADASTPEGNLKICMGNVANPGSPVDLVKIWEHTDEPGDKDSFAKMQRTAAWNFIVQMVA